MAAKVIKTTDYRGVKVRSGAKIVLHLTDDKGKIHLHLTWEQLQKFLDDLPIK